jgi:hypothetical protein
MSVARGWPFQFLTKKEQNMIDLPRTARSFESGAEYTGEISQIVVVPLPALSSDGISCAIKIGVYGKVMADSSLAAAEGRELKEFIHFDSKLLPLNDLARQLLTALPSAPRQLDDLRSIEGQVGRFRVGSANVFTNYNPVIAWQPEANFEFGDLVPATRSRYEFRRIGRQFIIRFDDGCGCDEGFVSVNSATEKLHMILKAAPNPVDCSELDGANPPGRYTRSACRLQDENGLDLSGSIAEPVVDGASISECLRMVQKLGDEAQAAHSIGALTEAREAETERESVFQFLLKDIGKDYWKDVKQLKEACLANDRTREKEIIRCLNRRSAKGRPSRSESEKARDRVRNSVDHGIKMLVKANLDRLAAHFTKHLKSEVGGFRYNDGALNGSWRL